MKARWGGGGHEIFFFVEGGNRKFSDVCLGGGAVHFKNLNPIPGAPLVVKNDASLMLREQSLSLTGTGVEGNQQGYEIF